MMIVWLVFALIFAGIGGFAYFTYRRTLRRAKGIERGLKMVPIQIHLPPSGQDVSGAAPDQRQAMREKMAQGQVLYDMLAGTALPGFKSNFYGQRHIAFEIIATHNSIRFFAAIPVALVTIVEKAIQSAYSGARLEQVSDHNLFNPQGKLAGVAAGELGLKKHKAYPIRTYNNLERDPLEAILNALSDLKPGDGVGIQLLLRPANPRWIKAAKKVASELRSKGQSGMKLTAKDFIKAPFKAPSAQPVSQNVSGTATGAPAASLSNIELAAVEAIEEKTRYPAYETLIRIIASSDVPAQAQSLLRDLSTAFALYEDPALNGFQFIPARDTQGMVTAFIFRFFPPELTSNTLNSQELATLFHLPEARFTPTAEVERQTARQADAPAKLQSQGILLGYNEFRGQRKEIRLANEDRRRHLYIVGQTGTGKSTLLETVAVQDMLDGRGFVFIDPHGDAAERLLGLIPKSRAEDVIYFDPADMASPLGLNLFEYSTPQQRDFIVQETINMLYKLYDPGHTGIIGPRYEHWFRNAALTLMSDPNGSTFIEIPKVFTDTEYLKAKFKHVKDPTVIDFWTKEMAATSDFHKSEVLGWFVSKFGAFLNNEMMRNILGQTKSSFNLREIMDQNRILIVNLSKGRVGELNSKLLGMVLVTKLQAAAMSRAETPEEQRADFSLMVDEFQNFSTDSFASILSEARKYRLNLVVANQFIGQLTPEIKNAVFGNVGSLISFRTGPEDADFLAKQFSPVFDQSDMVGLPNFYAVAKIMVAGLPSQSFSMMSLPPVAASSPEMAAAIKQLSAAKFGRPAPQVTGEIAGRLSSVQPSDTPSGEQPSHSPLQPGPAAAPPSGSPSIPGSVPASSPSPSKQHVDRRVPAAPSVSEPVTLSLSELNRTRSAETQSHQPPPAVSPATSPLKPSSLPPAAEQGTTELPVSPPAETPAAQMPQVPEAQPVPASSTKQPSPANEAPAPPPPAPAPPPLTQALPDSSATTPQPPKQQSSTSSAASSSPAQTPPSTSDPLDNIMSADQLQHMPLPGETIQPSERPEDSQPTPLPPEVRLKHRQRTDSQPPDMPPSPPPSEENNKASQPKISSGEVQVDEQGNVISG